MKRFKFFFQHRDNNIMNQKKLIILIILIVIISIVMILAVLNNNLNQSNNLALKENSPANSSYASSLEDINTLGVMPGTGGAPRQEVTAADKIPLEAIKLTVSDKGFSPEEFTVSAGETVKLALTSVGDNTHVFVFPQASLMALTMMVLRGETKVIEFKAPSTGSYLFRDDIPTFRKNTGMMTVK
jgi:heme/copper-type cytochrome/quinol oxidase subunit 2